MSATVGLTCELARARDGLLPSGPTGSGDIVIRQEAVAASFGQAVPQQSMEALDDLHFSQARRSVSRLHAVRSPCERTVGKEEEHHNSITLRPRRGCTATSRCLGSLDYGRKTAQHNADAELNYLPVDSISRSETTVCGPDSTLPPPPRFGRLRPHCTLTGCPSTLTPTLH